MVVYTVLDALKCGSFYYNEIRFQSFSLCCCKFFVLIFFVSVFRDNNSWISSPTLPDQPSKSKSLGKKFQLLIFLVFSNGGSAYYVSQQMGKDQGLVYVDGNDAVVLGVCAQQYQENRESVKLVSKGVYNQGLFIFDVASIPAVCGAWPALWMTGSNWPQDGEIDIIEGVSFSVSLPKRSKLIRD